MAEFAAKCEFFAQKYGMWFSQGDEISIEGENWSNSTPYGAFPWGIPIMLSAIADQNLFGLQILDFKPL